MMPTLRPSQFSLFSIQHTYTTEIYTLSLHDALPILDELWDALENEDLELNLSNTENYNTYRKTKAAEHIMENQPEGGYTVGYSESSDDDYEESVQKAVNNAHSLFLP